MLYSYKHITNSELGENKEVTLPIGGLGIEPKRSSTQMKRPAIRLSSAIQWNGIYSQRDNTYTKPSIKSLIRRAVV